MCPSQTIVKVAVVFCRVVTKPEYNRGAERWMTQYLSNFAGYEHELVVINRYADPPDDMFDRLGARPLRYDGGGWDCGTWQFAARTIETDLLMCFNASTYVTGHNWLKRFVEAVESRGDGLYGPLTSNYIIPHIRTPCMVFQPHVLLDYPNEVKDREDTYRFEVFGWPDGTPNFTQWVRQKNLATALVTWDGVYEQSEWRAPPNIFRRGDQSNLIVKDRHAEAYEVSEDKASLEAMANG